MSKFCGNCGAQVDDQVALCPNCGSQMAPAVAPAYAAAPEPKKGKGKIIAAIIAVIAVAAIACVAFFALKGGKKDYEPFLEEFFEAYVDADAKGLLEKTDYNHIISALDESIAGTEYEEGLEYLGYDSFADIMEEYLDLDDMSEDLSEIEEELGKNPDVTIEITDEKVYGKGEVDDFIDEWKSNCESYMGDIEIDYDDVDKITDVVKVDLDVEIKGKDDKLSEKLKDIILVKWDDEWLMTLESMESVGQWDDEWLTTVDLTESVEEKADFEPFLVEFFEAYVDADAERMLGMTDYSHMINALDASIVGTEYEEGLEYLGYGSFADVMEEYLDIDSLNDELADIKYEVGANPIITIKNLEAEEYNADEVLSFINEWKASCGSYIGDIEINYDDVNMITDVVMVNFDVEIEGEDGQTSESLYGLVLIKWGGEWLMTIDSMESVGL